MIWHDNSEICVKPAQPGIRALDLVCPVNDFFADDITIWSKSRPTNNLTDYMHLVENHSVMKISYCFQSMSLTPKPPSEELDKFLNEIVEFVDRRTRS
jgi:hypothetical protein